MATIDCSACEDLQRDAPDFVENGVTSTICNSLKNDTGFNPSLTVQHTDCEDLDTANDCLIGMMDSAVEKFEPCDWQPFMHRFIPNLHQFLKAQICAICGIWTNIHNIWAQIAVINAAISALQSAVSGLTTRVGTLETSLTNAWRKINDIEDVSDRVACIAEYIGNYKSLNITQDNITLGPGVSYRTEQVDGESVPAIPQITGNAFCAYLTGGIKLNSTWTALSGDISDGGRLVYTYKLKKSDFNIVRMWPANLTEANAGVGLIAHVQRFTAGQTAWGYESSQDPNGQVTVPSGYEYLQVRLVSVVDWGNARTNGEITLCGTMACLLDMSADC